MSKPVSPSPMSLESPNNERLLSGQGLADLDTDMLTLDELIEEDTPAQADDLTYPHYQLLRRIRHMVRENGTLFSLFSVVFVNLVGFGLVVPLISFFAESLHATAWQVGLMFSAYSLGQFFAEPLCGRLSDMIGRKPILLVTTGMSIIFYALLGFSPNIWVAIFIRFFSGLAAGNVSTIQAYVSDVSTPEKRTGRMSLIGAAFSLGFLAGPALGFLVREDMGLHGFRIPLFIAAAMAAIATLGVLLFVKETRPRKSKGKSSADRRPLRARVREDIGQTAHLAIKNPVIVQVILCTLCYMTALAGLEATFGLWSEQRYNWHSKDISTIFIYIGVTAALMQLVFTKPLVKRLGEARVLALGLFVFGLSFVLQALNHDRHLITPIVMFGTLGQAVIFANISAMISKATSHERQGALLGFNMSIGAVARIMGPILAGIFYSATGPDSALWLEAVFCAIAVFLAVFAGRNELKLPVS